MKNKNKFAALMASMGEVFDKKISRSLINTYSTALDGYSDEQVQDAVEKAILKLKWFPKPVELIEFIDQASGQDVAIEDIATASAVRILEHLRVYGATKWPDLSDDPVAKCLMTTRWHYKRWASQVLESELKWWQRDYVKAYRAMSESGNVEIRAQLPENTQSLVDGIGNMPEPN